MSIDRVNGEGSQVTVRGFGGGFNLVTLNGRALPRPMSPPSAATPMPTIRRAPAAPSTSATWRRKASARWKSTRPVAPRSRLAASVHRSTSSPASRSTRARRASAARSASRRSMTPASRRA
ncbi:hypothetical protein ACFSUK_19310 [Sphingobium scionense]